MTSLIFVISVDNLASGIASAAFIAAALPGAAGVAAGVAGVQSQVPLNRKRGRRALTALAACVECADKLPGSPAI